jgi:hypothetical protein
MIIRCALNGSGTPTDPYRVNLPSYNGLTDNQTTGRAFVDVLTDDVPADVQAFVAANPVADLVVPLPSPFTPALAASWSDHLTTRYALGTARWYPVVF